MRKDVLVPALAPLLLSGCLGFILPEGDDPYTSDTTLSLRDAHQCATEELVDFGYTIVETRRDDGVVKGRRGRDEVDGIDVLIFESRSGGRRMQVTPLRVEDGQDVDPSGRTRDHARDLMRACAG